MHQKHGSSKGRTRSKISKNTFTTDKSRDNFETIKSRFDSEIDKTMDNIIIFSKKKSKNAQIHKQRTKNKRIISSVVDHAYNKKLDNEKPNKWDTAKNTFKNSAEKQPPFESRHCRMKSMNIASPSLQILLQQKKIKTKPKFIDKKGRRSVSSLKHIENNLTASNTNIKCHRRVFESLSLPKSSLMKESRMSWDGTTSVSKIVTSKHTKSLSKDSKKSIGGSSKWKKASSKLNKHIENTLGYKSSHDKNIAALKKLKFKDPKLPLPNIYLKINN